MPIVPESGPLHTDLLISWYVTQGSVSRELKKIKVLYSNVKLQKKINLRG